MAPGIAARAINRHLHEAGVMLFMKAQPYLTINNLQNKGTKSGTKYRLLI